MRISDWSSDVCSSDLYYRKDGGLRTTAMPCGIPMSMLDKPCGQSDWHQANFISTFTPAARSSFISASTVCGVGCTMSSIRLRSEEHTSELQSLMRISYAVFCLKKKKNKTHTQQQLKMTT